MASPSTQNPNLVTAVPGPRSVELAKRLGVVESRNVTCTSPNPPVFWERAAGANVWDVDGNRYTDLCAGFGVANVGHAHPRVTRAIAEQARRMPHAMGDVHPAAIKVELLETLCELYPGGAIARGILGSSGSDAVEAAIKTAMLASGRAGIVAFEGSYHGLTFGALDATALPRFREPFHARLPGATSFATFGDAGEGLVRAAASCPEPVGAVLVEPIQGRGGERIPPDGFLSALRERCDREGWLLICDEVYTGFGRTGRWFACEHEGVVPDLLCVGKGLSSSMPISACLGKAPVMDAWPPSTGEALHTQTFLGHPVGCAAALASLGVLVEEKLVEKAAATGALALAHLRGVLDGRMGVVDVRGRGLLLAIECDTSALALEVSGAALRAGVIVIPSGADGRVLSITPPLCIDREGLTTALDLLVGCFA